MGFRRKCGSRVGRKSGNGVPEYGTDSRSTGKARGSSE